MTIEELKIQYALGSLTDNMKIKLADNLNTPVEVLTKLSTDEDWHVRYWVAYNTNTPIKVLTKLSKDESRGVRYCVAKNPNWRKHKKYDY